MDGQRFRWNPWRIFALNDWETPRVCVCVHVMHCTSYSWMKMPRKSDDRGRSLVLKKYFPSRESSSPETDDLSTRDKKSEIVINVEKLQVLRLRSFTCFPRVLFRTEWGGGIETSLVATAARYGCKASRWKSTRTWPRYRGKKEAQVSRDLTRARV